MVSRGRHDRRHPVQRQLFPGPWQAKARPGDSLAQHTAKTLQAAAERSLGSNRGQLAGEMIRQRVCELRLQEGESAKLDKLIEKARKALPDGPQRSILTIKGVGVQTAAALVAKIVSIDRFETARALIGYFVVFPEEMNVSAVEGQGNPGRHCHAAIGWFCEGGAKRG